MAKPEVKCPRCGQSEAPGAYCSNCGYKPGDDVTVNLLRATKNVRSSGMRVKLVAPPVIVTPPTTKPRRRVKAVEVAAGIATLAEAMDIVGVRSDDMTREAWLLAAVAKMRPWFPEGRIVPVVRISIGWPGGRSARLDALGQCWGPANVADGMPAIFITPSQDKPVQVLATTLHEMVHAAGEMNHRSGFRKLAKLVGFDPQRGKSGTSSHYRTPELAAKLEALYAELGPFPHAPVNKGTVLIGGKPAVQSTRMLKVACSVCEYSVRTTKKWLEVGIPVCPNPECENQGIEMVPEAKES